MTVPHVSAQLIGEQKHTYFGTPPNNTTCSISIYTADSSGPLTSPTDSGVVLVIGFISSVTASAAAPPTVSNITTDLGGPALTFVRYVDPRQDNAVPSASGFPPGQMGTELWWAYSNDPIPAGTTFTLTFDTALAYPSPLGHAYCFGAIFSGCPTPSAPWDPLTGLPSVLSAAPTTTSVVLNWDLTNGAAAAYSDGTTFGNIVYAGMALLGTDDDELALAWSVLGNDAATGSPSPYGVGWTSETSAGIGGNGGVPGTGGRLLSQAIAAPPPPPPPPDPYFPIEVLFPQTEAGNTSLDSTAAGIGEFSQAVLSVWFCRGPSDGSLVFQSVSADHAVSYAAVLSIGYVGSGPWTIDVSLYHTNTSGQIYQGSFSCPATTLNSLANIILSFDTATNAIHVYVNDTAATSVSETWSSTSTVNSAPIDHWNLEVVGGIADFVFEAGVYLDFSDVTNRRLFHNADLSAVDVEHTHGASAQAFFTIRSSEPGGGIASDFAYNDNSPGPSWDIINGPLEIGDCAIGSDTPGTPAYLLPGQIVFWGLTLGGVGSITSTPVGDGSGDAGASSIIFTGLAPGPSDLNTPVGGAGEIIFTGRKPGAIFLRYRDPRTPSFFAVELDVYSSGSGAETLRVSDIGYRSRASDTIGLQVYPAVLDIAFDIDRHLGLEPGASSSAGFGSITLHNVGQRFDAYTLSRNSDSRNVKILVGNKSTDSSRGVLVDPPYAELRPFFGGAALPWTLSEGSLEIPLRDATYWADRPLQTRLYDGSGGYGGGQDLKGKPLPVTRGGLLPNNPVENVPLVAVDTVNLIYQWTDGPGHLVNLYEGGALVFSSEGTTTDLYSGATSPGCYRVDETRGLVQLGSTPIRTLTADVTGAFAVAGHKSTAVDIARYVLTELMGQPESELEVASWYNADARYPYTAGFFVGPEQQQGLDTVRYLLGSIGARLFTFRDGRLGVSILRALASDVVPSLTINRDTAISVDPVPLPSALDPPPWRWRVGSYRMHQVQTSDFDAAINPVRKTHIGQEYPFLSLSEAPELKDIWRRPKDPDPIPTALINVFAAQDLSDDLLALWRNRPGLYQVTMPYEQSAEMEIGDVVLLDWPLADLDGGKAGQVVGEQVRSYDGTGKIYVLAG